jgi:hypothetical protein
MAYIIISYETIGILSGISAMIMLLSTLYIGKICDRRDKRIVLRLSSFFYAFTWIAKIFARTIMPIFVFDTFAKTAKSGVDVSMRSLVYSSARSNYRNSNDENNNSIMEGCVNFEAGLIIGKVFACLAMLIIALIVSSLSQFFVLAFIFSAIMTLFYAIL